MRSSARAGVWRACAVLRNLDELARFMAPSRKESPIAAPGVKADRPRSVQGLLRTIATEHLDRREVPEVDVLTPPLRLTGNPLPTNPHQVVHILVAHVGGVADPKTGMHRDEFGSFVVEYQFLEELAVFAGQGLPGIGGFQAVRLKRGFAAKVGAQPVRIGAHQFRMIPGEVEATKMGEHCIFMIAAYKDRAIPYPKEAFDNSARVRAAVDVIAEEDQLIGRRDLHQHVIERPNAAVNVANNPRCHSGNGTAAGAVHKPFLRGEWDSRAAFRARGPGHRTAKARAGRGNGGRGAVEAKHGANMDPLVLWASVKMAAPSLLAALTLLGTYGLLSQLLRYAARRGLLMDRIVSMLRRGLRYLVLLLFALLIAQAMGLGVGSIWTFVTTTLALVAVGFIAVWSVISNVLCALLLISIRPFRIGDEIAIVDTSSPDKELRGVVINIDWFYTSLAPPSDPDSVLLVPNFIFFQKYVRRKAGASTISLVDQIFEVASLLPGVRERPED